MSSKQVTKKTDSTLEQIQKEYAAILVYEMLNINDVAVLADSAYNLRQLDSKLKQKVYRTTINVGTKDMNQCIDKNCTCKNHKKKSYDGVTIHHDYH